MKQYKKPEFHFVNNTGGLSGDEIAKLSDEDLAKYLQSCNYTDEKKKYRIRQGFILREIAGEYAIIPVGEECIITNAVMTPNDTAVFLWKVFQKPSTTEDAVRKGIQEYDASEDTIRNAIKRFVNDTLKNGILEEVG